MVDVTDAAIEALAEELRRVFYKDNVFPGGEAAWKYVARHVLASRQPKPEDVDLLVRTMKESKRGYFGQSGEEIFARAILALYDAPARIPTRSALDSALDPILGDGVARRAVVDAVLGVIGGAPTGLTFDFVRSLPGGKPDDATYEQIETELDCADAPCQDAAGKWLTLPERIKAQAARIATLEAELAADSEAVSELRDDLERALSELAAAKSPTIRLGEGLTEAQEANAPSNDSGLRPPPEHAAKELHWIERHGAAPLVAYWSAWGNAWLHHGSEQKNSPRYMADFGWRYLGPAEWWPLLYNERRRPEAINSVVGAARRFSDCAAEFDGDLAVCHEYIDALWTAVDRLKQTEESALRASAAPKAEAVDWVAIARDHLDGVGCSASEDAIITGLCEQLTALRSAAGGSV